MAAILLFSAFIKLVGCFSHEEAKASVYAPPDVNYPAANSASRYVADAFLKQKTLDISKSSLDISISKNEEKSALQKADEGVIKWLLCVAFVDITQFMTSDYKYDFSGAYLNDGEDPFKKTPYTYDNDHLAFLNNSNGVPFYSPKYWYEDKLNQIMTEVSRIRNKTTDEELHKDLSLLEKIKDKYKTGTELLAIDPNKDSDIQKFVWQHIGTIENDPGALGIRAKREEIYNDRYSDLLTGKISGKLEYKFRYDIVPLDEEGSEDEAYDVGNVEKHTAFGAGGAGDWFEAYLRVYRGTLNSSKLKLSMVDFGGSKQFYDQILKEDINAQMAGVTDLTLAGKLEQPMFYRSIKLGEKMLTWDEAKELEFGADGTSYLPRDLRSTASHVITIDSGHTVNTDYAYSFDSEPRGSTGYPGQFSFLDVSSPNAYDFAVLGKPLDGTDLEASKSSNTTFYALNIDQDLISNIEQDENGKITSISKPLLTYDEYNTALARLHNRVMSSSLGIYRYKLIESVASANGDSDKVEEVTNEKVLDILKEQGRLASENVNEQKVQYTINIFDSVDDAKQYYQDTAKEQNEIRINYITWASEVATHIPKVEFKSELLKISKDDKKEEEISGNVKSATPSFVRLGLKSSKQTKASETITWKKIKGAKKYVIMGNRCGKKNTEIKKVKANKYTVKKIAGKRLKKGAYYKYYVLALDKNSKIISRSKTIYVATKGGKYCNHRAVRVTSKKAVALKKGKICKIKARAIKAYKNRKVKKYCGLRYESANPYIATVTKKGVIKARNKGACKIYVYAQNGIAKAVKVKVK